jgi:hypothetical protein
MVTKNWPSRPLQYSEIVDHERVVDDDADECLDLAPSGGVDPYLGDLHLGTSFTQIRRTAGAAWRRFSGRTAQARRLVSATSVTAASAEAKSGKMPKTAAPEPVTAACRQPGHAATASRAAPTSGHPATTAGARSLRSRGHGGRSPWPEAQAQTSGSGGVQWLRSPRPAKTSGGGHTGVRSTDHDGLDSRIRDRPDLLAPSDAKGGAADEKERDVAAEFGAESEQVGGGSVEPPQLAEQHQRRCGVGRPAAQTTAHRDPLGQDE